MLRGGAATAGEPGFPGLPPTPPRGRNLPAGRSDTGGRVARGAAERGARGARGGRREEEEEEEGGPHWEDWLVGEKLMIFLERRRLLKEGEVRGIGENTKGEIRCFFPQEDGICLIGSTSQI